MPEEIMALLKNGAREVGVTLNRQMMTLLLMYFHELKVWNQKFNLTSLRNDRALVLDHFIDSLSVVPHLPPTGTLMDIGSGAGFPGLPIKIAKPALDVTLLEAKRKKINFLRQMIILLNLSQIAAVQGRIEKLAAGSESGLFDMLVARAFATLEPLLKQAIPLLKPGGQLIAMKSKEGEKELTGARSFLKTLSLEVVKKVELELPETHKKRVLFFIMKR